MYKVCNAADITLVKRLHQFWRYSLAETMRHQTICKNCHMADGLLQTFIILVSCCHHVSGLEHYKFEGAEGL